MTGQVGTASAADAATLAAVERFNAAFNCQDIDATMAAMTADCVFENTSPAPDGTRCEGADAVRREFSAFFASSPHAHFEAEEQFAAGERCVVRWLYRWQNAEGGGHVRGVDIFRVRDGKVAEKLSYVKGYLLARVLRVARFAPARLFMTRRRGDRDGHDPGGSGRIHRRCAHRRVGAGRAALPPRRQLSWDGAALVFLETRGAGRGPADGRVVPSPRGPERSARDRD